MTVGEIEYAERKAKEAFDRWNEITGFVPEFSGYYHEIQACIEDAVHIGAMVACGEKVRFNDDGELIRSSHA